MYDHCYIYCYYFNTHSNNNWLLYIIIYSVLQLFCWCLVGGWMDGWIDNDLDWVGGRKWYYVQYVHTHTYTYIYIYTHILSLLSIDFSMRHFVSSWLCGWSRRFTWAGTTDSDHLKSNKPIWRFPKIGLPKSLWVSILWMIWGDPFFRRAPYRPFHFHPSLAPNSIQFTCQSAQAKCEARFPKWVGLTVGPVG